MQSSILRAICAVVIGVLLVRTPDSTVLGITIAIGVLFLISGVVSVVANISQRQSVKKAAASAGTEGELPRKSPMFPIVGVGSILLGLLLALMPGTFVSFLMYFLGAVLILGALSQMFTLISASRSLRVPWLYYIFPAVIFLVGLFVLLKPMESASLPLLIIGWCMIVYGVVECVNAVKLHIALRKLSEELNAAAEAASRQEEAQEVSEDR